MFYFFIRHTSLVREKKNLPSHMDTFRNYHFMSLKTTSKEIAIVTAQDS